MAENDLNYWMGRVDAQLADLVKQVSKLTSEITQDLRDIRAWRDTVETRLLSGSARFEDHERRIVAIENGKADCPLGEECPHNNGKADERNVTWPWLLERVFAPALGTIIALVIGYLFAKLTGAIP